MPVFCGTQQIMLCFEFNRALAMEFLVYQHLCSSVITKTTDEQQTELALSLVRLRIQWPFVSCKCAAHHVMPG